MSFSAGLRALVLAFGAGLAIAVAGAPAGALEAPPGSKNFTPPADVPNYFSNESGPFHSGATAHTAQPSAVPVAIAPPVHGGHAVASRRDSRHRHPTRLAKGGGRTRLAHGKTSGHRQVAHAGATRHGHASKPIVAHASALRRGYTPDPKVAHAAVAHLHGKTVAAKSRAAVSKAKHPARSHG